MESLTVAFTDEEWAELKAAAGRSNVGLETFAHDAVLAAARSHAAREEHRRSCEDLRRRLREESAAIMNNPHEQAELRRIYVEMQDYAPPVPD